MTGRFRTRGVTALVLLGLSHSVRTIRPVKPLLGAFFAKDFWVFFVDICKRSRPTRGRLTRNYYIGAGRANVRPSLGRRSALPSVSRLRAQS